MTAAIVLVTIAALIAVIAAVAAWADSKVKASHDKVLIAQAETRTALAYALAVVSRAHAITLANLPATMSEAEEKNALEPFDRLVTQLQAMTDGEAARGDQATGQATEGATGA